MADLPPTIPGWETLGYRFIDTTGEPDAGKSPDEYGYQVTAPDGVDLGPAIGDIPESASAAACNLARANHLSNGR